jgi:hypothetical protein
VPRVRGACGQRGLIDRRDGPAGPIRSLEPEVVRTFRLASHSDRLQRVEVAFTPAVAQVFVEPAHARAINSICALQLFHVFCEYIR